MRDRHTIHISSNQGRPSDRINLEENLEEKSLAAPGRQPVGSGVTVAMITQPTDALDRKLTSLPDVRLPILQL